jgi:PadR family transcriptional regulator, regulatory protein PadR
LPPRSSTGGPAGSTSCANPFALDSCACRGIDCRCREGDALRGHLELLLLAALARAEQHGYALIEWLRNQSAGALDLGEGSVYPALRRLEAAGFVTSSWRTDGGRRKRVYRLTKRGEARLRSEREGWNDLVRTVGLVLEAS